MNRREAIQAAAAAIAGAALPAAPCDCCEPQVDWVDCQVFYDTAPDCCMAEGVVVFFGQPVEYEA